VNTELELITWLETGSPFPHPSSALHQPNGLLAAGGDLTPERLLSAYRQGIFPWFSEGEPTLWWSPNPRMVLYPKEFHPSRSLLKTLRNGDYEVRIDHDFSAVIASCAAPREGQAGTWINAEMVEAYERLHSLGYAHSFETWRAGKLVGGLYGVAMGGIFFGESMFSRRTDASKIAFSHLVAHLLLNDFHVLDCQMHTDHLSHLKAREIPRKEFLQEVARYRDQPFHLGPWTMHKNGARDQPWRLNTAPTSALAELESSHDINE
jgi:leucyl/phenylalanyl-tRNA--protein transferase